MKRALFSTTALVGAGLVCSAPAWAESPIRLTIGGFYRAAYMAVVDDNDGFLGPFDVKNEPGFDKNEDGFFSDAEVHFSGRTVLDNGLEIGARIELEGENDGPSFVGASDSDQIDEAWIYFAGGFGEIRIGSDDEALSNSCLLPPGGTANFSAFSPNQWGANSLSAAPFGAVTNSACTGVDDRSDAQKIIYFSPVFFGFQLAGSYTPNPDSERHDDGVGTHVGMPLKTFGTANPDADSDASVYLTYSYNGDNWGMSWGGGGSWEMGTDSTLAVDFEDQDFYQTALNVFFDRFSIGGVFEYYNDLNSFRFIDSPFGQELNAWVAGGGISYTYNAWTFGGQYSYRQDTFREEFAGPDLKFEQVQQRAVATVNYVLGPGISLDGEVGYTWRDQDPEADEDFSSDDDYQGLEIGIGTALTF